MLNVTKEHLLENKFLPYILMTIPMIIGGTTWPLGKWLVSSYYGPTIPQLIIVISRYFVALPIFFIILFFKEKGFHLQFVKDNYKFLALMGLVNVTIYQIGYMYGETYTTGTEASLIIGTNPLAVFLITLIFLNYKITARHLLGIVVGFIGILMVIFFETNSTAAAPNPTLGNMLIILAVISFSSYTVLLKVFMNKFQKSDTKPSSLAILTWLSFFGTIFILPITFFINPSYLTFQAFFNIPFRIWLGIFYLGIFPTVIGFLMYVEGIKLLGPNKAIIFINIIPIVGVALSALLLGEKINIFVHIGALILIFLSIYLVNKKSKPKNTLQDSKEETTHLVKSL